MDKKYYEKYHEDGAGRSGFVGEKRVPLNNMDKAIFVEKYLKGKILDVGCGSGFDANYFHSNGYNIEGTDISETVIKNAKERFHSINFFVHNFETSELGKKYNTICCFEVIEHVFDYKTFLSSIRDALEDEGLLIMSTPNIFGLASYIRLLLRDGAVFGITTSDDSHIRFFSINTLEKTLIKSGFGIVKIRTFSTRKIPFLPNGMGGSIVIIAKKVAQGD